MLSAVVAGEAPGCVSDDIGGGDDTGTADMDQTRSVVMGDAAAADETDVEHGDSHVAWARIM